VAVIDVVGGWVNVVGGIEEGDPGKLWPEGYGLVVELPPPVGRVMEQSTRMLSSGFSHWLTCLVG